MTDLTTSQVNLAVFLVMSIAALTITNYLYGYLLKGTKMPLSGAIGLFSKQVLFIGLSAQVIFIAIVLFFIIVFPT